MADIFMLAPIGHVRGGRAEAVDDDWDRERAVIELAEGFDAEALAGLDGFSHAEIVFLFDRVPDAKIERGARRPRGNPDWPPVGIFAQRGKNRPNRLGVTVCAIERVEGTRLFVRGLDAIHGTPVLDIKPVMLGFQPRGDIREPDWAGEIMRDYWSADHTPPPLRWAGPDDYDALGDVMFDAVRNGPSQYSEKQRVAWVGAPRTGPDWHARLAMQEIVMAERGGRAIGFMSLADKGYLDFAYIRPEAQGTGLFRRMWERIRARAVARGEAEVHTHASLMAEPAFRGVGFEVVEAEQVELGGETFDRFAMRITLG